MAERTSTAELVIAAPPWDVFELLVDPEQQAQWRERFEPHAQVVEQTPYTLVRFEDGLLVELRPEGAGTAATATRTQTGSAIGLALSGRRRLQDGLRDQLRRIGASVEYGAL